MVCNRCILVIEQELKKAKIVANKVMLGVIELGQIPKDDSLSQFKIAIEQLGFEVIDDKKNRMIEQMKNIIRNHVQHPEDQPNNNLSEILHKELHQDYKYLSKLFSEVEGMTIEKYVIAQKTEKIKELLTYGELSLSEIAHLLHYSSVAYLSNQFKRVTGLTPTRYKELKNTHRKSIDNI